MAPTRLKCPSCSAGLRLTQQLPAGRKIKCPKCGTAFLPNVERAEEAVRSAPVAQRPATAGYSDNETRSPRRRSRSQRSKQTVPVGLIVGLGALVLLVAVGAVAAVVVVRMGKKSDQVASAPTPASNRNETTPSAPAAPTGRRDDSDSSPPTPPNESPGFPSDPGPGAGKFGPGAGLPTGPSNPPGPPPGEVMPGRPSAPNTPKPPSGLVGLEVGDTAMEISAEDIDGKKFKLSDYRGKVVVLDFWGHW